MAVDAAPTASTELASEAPSSSCGALWQRLGAACKRKEPPTSRVFQVDAGGMPPDHKHPHFPNNNVSTAKYTLLSFLPKSLFEQFRRLANVYFLVIVVLLMLGTYTDFFQAPLTPYTTLLPLLVVLAVTMGKEGFEDLKRHLADMETNNRKAFMLSTKEAGALDECKWRDIAVGRIVKVTDKQEIPADLILLTSSEHDGNCYVETSNIDGETNLKVKEAAKTSVDGLGPLWKAADPAELFGWSATLECELPNSRIHQFTGVLHWNEQPNRQTPVDQSNLLLRGSSLRNTKWVLGLVVFTGYDTKIVRNSRTAPSKLSSVERTVNRLLYLILGTQVILSTVSLIFYAAWSRRHYTSLDYICLDPEAPDTSFYNRKNCGGSEAEASILGMWVTFFTLFNNFVPISLYVTLEMVNYIQAYYIDTDIQMYDEGSNTPAVARTSNMNADLASVQYVFSDKTGTLTQNVMRFKRCSVAGRVYGNMDEAPRPGQEGVIMGRPLDELASLAQRGMAKGAGVVGGGEGEGATAVDALLVLSLCHTVVMEKKEDGTQDYQAESPDEEALVSAAGDLGFRFSGRDPGGASVILPTSPEQASNPSSSSDGASSAEGGPPTRFAILCTIPFTSTRKRMSVVVRLQSGRLVLMCKGADNVIIDRAARWRDTTKAEMDNHLRAFALDGLRTLMLAMKEVEEAEFEAWFKEWKAACASMQHREEAMGKVAESIEQGLVVVGATAIEDKLQDGVPDTIADLKDSGIKVWVLTGDKMETAINIGYSCRLISSNLVLLKLKDEGSAEAIQSMLKRLVRRFRKLIEVEKGKKDTLLRRIIENWNASLNINRGPLVREPSDIKPAEDDEEWTKCFEPQADAPTDPDLLTPEQLALVVDGPALVHIFGHKDLEALFLQLASIVGALIACRVSPAQKRMIVRLVKKGVKPKPITLSIGDGANDVAMIQEAQIGVGISGKEGKQAVNSADFAIAQFRFLRRLLLIHGRWDYRRMAKVILYSFYKNIVLTMILFYFSFFTGFSGQSLYDDWVYAGYNFFLAMPIICVGIFDRDMSEAGVAQYKWVYMSGRDHMDLNLSLMLQWLIQALLDSVLLFYFCYGAYSGPMSVWGDMGHGDTNGLLLFGTTVYSGMFLSMIYKAGNAALTWTPVTWFFYFGSIALYLIFLFTYGSLLWASQSFFHVPHHMMRLAMYWLLLLLVPTVSFAIDYGVMAFKTIFFPTPVDIAIELDRLHTWERQERAAGRMTEISQHDVLDDDFMTTASGGMIQRNGLDEEDGYGVEEGRGANGKPRSKRKSRIRQNEGLPQKGIPRL